jgi:hypothetical protein
VCLNGLRVPFAAIALLSIVHKVLQRIFSRSDQILDDTAEEEEDAVFPAAVRFAGVVPTVFKMYGSGWRELAWNHVDMPNRVRFEYFHGMFDSKGEYLQVAMGYKCDSQ